MEKIKINSNLKSYQVVDENDNELGVIKVNVTDFGFFNRAIEVEKNVAEIIARFEQFRKEKEDLEDIFEQLEVFDKEIKEQLNKLFDYDVANVVFGNKNCLSITDGELFVNQFMEAILPVIKKDIAEESEKSHKKMSKYLEGYAE